MITTVKAYKTSNGKVFSSELEAQKEEFKIKVRGFVNRTLQDNKLNERIELDPGIFAEVIEHDFTGFTSILGDYKRTRARLKKKEPVAV